MILDNLVQAWRHDPYYQHGLLQFALACVLAIFLFKTRNPKSTLKKKSCHGYWLIGVGLLATTGLIVKGSLGIWMETVAILMLLRWLAHVRWGQGSHRFNIVFILMFLTIPLPGLSSVINAMQSSTAHLLLGTLQLLGTPALLEGMTLNTGLWSFTIAGNCSGFSSLLILITVALLLAEISRWPVRTRVLFTLGAIPLAVAANIIRLISLSWIGDNFGKAVAMNYWHDKAGLVFYLAGLCGLAAVGWWIERQRSTVFKSITLTSALALIMVTLTAV